MCNKIALFKFFSYFFCYFFFVIEVKDCMLSKRTAVRCKDSTLLWTTNATAINLHFNGLLCKHGLARQWKRSGAMFNSFKCLSLVRARVFTFSRFDYPFRRPDLLTFPDFDDACLSFRQHAFHSRYRVEAGAHNSLHTRARLSYEINLYIHSPSRLNWITTAALLCFCVRIWIAQRQRSPPIQCFAIDGAGSIVAPRHPYIVGAHRTYACCGWQFRSISVCILPSLFCICHISQMIHFSASLGTLLMHSLPYFDITSIVVM